MEGAVRARLADELGGLARAVQGIGDHDRADGEREDRLAQPGPLGRVLLVEVAELAEDHAGVDVDRRKLLPGGLLARLADLAQIVVAGPAQGLAVDRKRLAITIASGLR